MHLTSTALLSHAIAQPVMTGLELALMDKLYSALDEVDALIATLAKLQMEQAKTETEAGCGHT